MYKYRLSYICVQATPSNHP